MDIPVVNMPIPQNVQNIEDDEEPNEESSEEENEKDEDFEKFVADTERAKQDAVKVALCYARSMKKEKKLERIKEEQLNRREALIGDREREIERRVASLATKEDTLKRKEGAPELNEIRISREENLQERVRDCLVQHQGNYYIHRLVLKEIKEEKVQNFRI
jgi:hypothetical protein